MYHKIYGANIYLTEKAILNSCKIRLDLKFPKDNNYLSLLATQFIMSNLWCRRQTSVKKRVHLVINKWMINLSVKVWSGAIIKSKDNTLLLLLCFKENLPYKSVDATKLEQLTDDNERWLTEWMWRVSNKSTDSSTIVVWSPSKIWRKKITKANLGNVILK